MSFARRNSNFRGRMAGASENEHRNVEREEIDLTAGLFNDATAKAQYEQQNT